MPKATQIVKGCEIMAPIYTEKILLPLTPEQLEHVNQCAVLAKKPRVELVRRLIEQAYQDAVRCGCIKEAVNEQSNQAGA